MQAERVASLSYENFMGRQARVIKPPLHRLRGFCYEVLFISVGLEIIRVLRVDEEVDGGGNPSVNHGIFL